ncbi:MAG: D-amino acid aminotransferase [Gammaproteobacteria bacterium]|nr:D-amino acid aminotransferase [Gammaproteobacteria bacterium]
MTLPLPVVWLDGRLLPLAEAKISPLDRGFLFGDGVYEVLPIYRGRAYRLDAHLERLDRSLRGIGMDPVLDRAGWIAVFSQLVQANGGGDQLLYVQVTRGVEPERNHVPQPGTRPTVFACVAPLPMPGAEVLERGTRAVTAADLRWGRCDLKTIALIGNVLARSQAATAGASEAILLRDGWLTEGSASSAHIVVSGELVTPPQSQRILPGTTRGAIFEIAERAGIAHRERPVSESELRGADEIILASAGGGIRAVTMLDGTPISDGLPGPIFRLLYDGFLATRLEFSTTLPA